jgi:ankyrin repeat protein
MMTEVKTASPRLKSLSIVGMVAIGLLTACGDRVSSEAPLSPTTEGRAKANPTTLCFNAVGLPNKNDAEVFAASIAGDARRVEQSINAGGNVNATDFLKRTPLFAASFCNHPEVANLLIDKGSDVNARDFLGMSPLHSAVVMGCDAAAKALILKSAQINIQDNRGHSPLHLAAATNQMAMVKLLLEHGADAQVRDKDGVTATSLASDNGHKLVVATINKWHEKQKNSIQK